MPLSGSSVCPMHRVVDAHVVAGPTDCSEETCGCGDRIDVRPARGSREGQWKGTWSEGLADGGSGRS